MIIPERLARAQALPMVPVLSEVNVGKKAHVTCSADDPLCKVLYQTSSIHEATARVCNMRTLASEMYFEL